jgi:hypothetical protein
MRFYVLWPDGQRFGPADEALLRQWAQEGRLKPETVLQNESTGQEITAQQFGLFPEESPTAPPGAEPLGPTREEQTREQGATGSYQPYGTGQPSASAGSPSNYPRYFDENSDQGKTEGIVSLVLSVVGVLFCCCFPLSIGGIVLGVISKNKNHPIGVPAIVVGIICTLIGIGYYALVFLTGFGI